MQPIARRPKVIIIGGGFGGLYAARSLKNTPVDVTLIDKRNFHLFQPLLYQVATGGLSPADISFPLRAIFKRQKNARVILGEVSGIDPDRSEVIVGGQALPYDKLIVAAGATHHYFGHSDWASAAPGLKTIEDATAIRSRILCAFEQAELTTDPEKRNACLTFVIVGGGAAGVELAGALAELSRETLKNDFRSIDPGDARILIVEASSRILPVYPESLSEKAKNKLMRLGVEVLTDTSVTQVYFDRLELKTGQQTQILKAQTTLWAAGVKAATFPGSRNKPVNLALDKAGRVVVNEFCQAKDCLNIFVIGDMARFEIGDGQILPGTAPVAMQQGRYVADVISKMINDQPYAKFRYRDKGNLAVIGRRAAVAFRGKVRFSGFFAWILWIFVHLLYLVGFQNRVLVAVQWGFNYISRNRSARLITFPKETLPSRTEGT